MICRTSALRWATAVALIVVLTSAANAAPKNVDPATIQRKVVERGAGRSICADIPNGTAVVGRIASISELSFGMQLDNDPDVTTISYADVPRVPSVWALAARAWPSSSVLEWLAQWRLRSSRSTR
jgi:hypothetical protein